MDDLSGFVGALAGLANDARNTAMNKAEKFKQSIHAADEIDSLKLKISDLESRIQILEQSKKDTKA